MKPPASGNHGASGCSAPLDGLALASLSPDQHTSAISSSRCATSGATSMTTTAQRSHALARLYREGDPADTYAPTSLGGGVLGPSLAPVRTVRIGHVRGLTPGTRGRSPEALGSIAIGTSLNRQLLRARSVATMLPRLGSTRGDSRRLEGTTAWLEREDRQRLSARSPLLS